MGGRKEDEGNAQAGESCEFGARNVGYGTQVETPVGKIENVG